jgi:N-acetylneuraminic acid mutarotase
MDAQFVCFNDTWTYNLAANTWTEVSPASEAPSARTSACMVYDAAKGRAILFGGLDAQFVCSNDTWEFDPAANAWSEHFPAGGSPPARGRASLVYADATETIILFGGWFLESGPEGEFSGQAYLNDLWAYGVNL